MGNLATPVSVQKLQRALHAKAKAAPASWLGELGQSLREGYFRQEATDLVGRLNRTLAGWANYFKLGPVSRAYRAIDAHVSERLRHWLSGKHQRAGRGYQRYSDAYLYEHLSLIRLTQRTRNLPWAKA